MATTTSPFGVTLRRWRSILGVSQLELAHRAETTPRHVSFLESGRSRPSEEMVGRLAEALDVPLRDRNTLFSAAGFAAAYPESGWDSADLAPFRAVLRQLLDKHDPYPAYVIDRHYAIVAANAAAEAFLPPAGERNAIRLVYAGAWRDLIANWADLAWPGVRRLQREAALHPEDDDLAALLALARQAAEGVPDTRPDATDRVLCPHFRVGDRIVRTMSVVAGFGQPLDVTLEELRIELIYPADEEARAFFTELAAG